jgi:calcineurin-like phosphoesterase family protein
MSDTWFTADFHLGHQNIIRYCNRPFRKRQSNPPFRPPAAVM